MTSREEIEVLLSDIESDRIERTRSVDDTAKFSQAVCAFANDLPNHRQSGYLVIGVDDGGGPVGIEVSDRLLQNLAGLRSDGNILPLPAVTVEKVGLPGGNVAVVTVQPSDLPPVRFQGQIWVRVGPRKAIASEQEERILSERRVTQARSFDATPVGDAGLADLSLPLFAAYRHAVVAAEVIAADRRTHEEQLASLRFFDLRSGKPLVAGVLMFCARPRYFLPGAYVQYLKLPGTTLTAVPDDQAEITGDLLSVLRELITRVKAGIHTALRRRDWARERMIPDYPEIAIREFLLNAIMHRDYQSTTPIRFYWYADRIEIQNPGGLYGSVTTQTLTSRSSYRNPVLAEGMKGLGYVNRFGYGIQQAESALRENGNPPAEFAVDPYMFKVTVREAIIPEEVVRPAFEPEPETGPRSAPRPEVTAPARAVDTVRRVPYFVSCAHGDRALKDGLLKRLHALLDIASDYRFESWPDGDIPPGPDWHFRVQAAIADGAVGLLLVSPAFLSSVSGHGDEREIPVCPHVIPVARRLFPRDGSVNLRGLDRSPMFFYRGKPFGQLRAGPEKDGFAQALFSRIIDTLKDRDVMHVPPSARVG